MNLISIFPKKSHTVGITIALVKVVHMAVYIFFGVSLLADQWIIWRKPGDEEIDLVFPFFIAFKFLFIFG